MKWKYILESMKSRIHFVILYVFVLGLMVASPGCRKRKFKGDGELVEFNMNDGDWDRTGWMYLPKDYEGYSKKLPLIIALHGRGGTGKGTVPFMELNPNADAYGYLIAYPDGISRSWADARHGSPAYDRGVDDVRFLSRLIDEAVARYHADPDRIYMVGMSNGGFMTTTFACALPKKVAAVATVTGNMAPDPATWCMPDTSVSIMFIMGTEDPLVPYGGGEITDGKGHGNGTYTASVAESVAFWAGADSCAGQPEIFDYPDTKKDGCSMRETRYTTCNGNSEVRLIDVIGGGHTWPGGSQYWSKRRIGRVCQELQAANMVFEFFDRH